MSALRKLRAKQEAARLAREATTDTKFTPNQDVKVMAEGDDDDSSSLAEQQLQTSRTKQNMFSLLKPEAEEEDSEEVESTSSRKRKGKSSVVTAKSLPSAKSESKTTTTATKERQHQDQDMSSSDEELLDGYNNFSESQANRNRNGGVSPPTQTTSLSSSSEKSTTTTTMRGKKDDEKKKGQGKKNSGGANSGGRGMNEKGKGGGTSTDVTEPKADESVTVFPLYRCDTNRFNVEGEVRKRFGISGGPSSTTGKSPSVAPGSADALKRARSRALTKGRVMISYPPSDWLPPSSLYKLVNDPLVPRDDPQSSTPNVPLDRAMSSPPTRGDVTLTVGPADPTPLERAHAHFLRFTCSEAYHALQQKYQRVLNSFDPDAILQFNERHPEHVEAVLQVANLAESSSQHNGAHEFIRYVRCPFSPSHRYQ